MQESVVNLCHFCCPIHRVVFAWPGRVYQMQKWYKMGPYQLKTMLVYNPLIDGDFWMGNSNYNPKKRSFFGEVLGPYLKQAAGPICPDLSPPFTLWTVPRHWPTKRWSLQPAVSFFWGKDQIGYKINASQNQLWTWGEIPRKTYSPFRQFPHFTPFITNLVGLTPHPNRVEATEFQKFSPPKNPKEVEGKDCFLNKNGVGNISTWNRYDQLGTSQLFLFQTVLQQKLVGRLNPFEKY